MSHNFTDLSWEGFRDRVPSQTDLVIVPVGTIEAHGAIPLGTDNIIPGSMAADLAPRLGGLVAPPVTYGVTNSLLPYPGSTTVSSETFQAYLFEAAAGLVRAGFRRVVLLNGHGGQTSEVNRVVNRLWDETGAFAVAVEWWGLAAEISHEVYGEVASGHAGVEETALVLAVAPELIDS
jgi:creatinine amidohydrolase